MHLLSSARFRQYLLGNVLWVQKAWCCRRLVVSSKTKMTSKDEVIDGHKNSDNNGKCMDGAETVMTESTATAQCW